MNETADESCCGGTVGGEVDSGSRADALGGGEGAEGGGELGADGDGGGGMDAEEVADGFGVHHRGESAQLEHIAEGDDEARAETVGGLARGGEGNPHGARVGVVGIVDDDDTADLA